jgi:hypothetical protein
MKIKKNIKIIIKKINKYYNFKYFDKEEYLNFYKEFEINNKIIISNLNIFYYINIFILNYKYLFIIIILFLYFLM